MLRETKFADVILPLALPRLLTYRIPLQANDLLIAGQRVVVPLGKSKLLAGVVHHIHTVAPSGYEARYITDILDERPIINETQLALWDWIARYYCCTVGEVMNAALPAGLKLSSETRFVLSEPDSGEVFDGNTEIIVDALRNREKLSLDEISGLPLKGNPHSIVKKLVEEGILASEEEIREKYKPRMKDFVRLGVAADNADKLKSVFDQLEKKNAQKQSDALLVFLRMSDWDEGRATEVERLKLQKSAAVNSAVITSMCARNIFEVYSREVGRLPAHLLASDSTKPLSVAQQTAADEIREQWQNHDVCLLHGVTSSGKTEIYSTLIQEVLDQDKQVLFLLPEIALTTQIIQRLRKFFGKRVGIYHSGYSDNERTEVWNKVLSDVPGECDVILGARSSLFLPFNRLGLVIVDEEHENSFKQHDPAPRYHARDTATWLASQFGAKVLLGSATPSIESYFNTRQERYGLVTLSERYGGLELPEVIITDLRSELKAKTMKNNFSSVLLAEMKAALQAGEQVILFQNRRGYSPLWECHTCGWIPMCTRCDVSLTYHKQSHQLRCHYCGYHIPPLQNCQACGSTDIKMLGFGTEKVEEDLAAFLPEAKAQRMDLDTTRSRQAYQNIISDFESGITQVLVGTSMVTKGLDFDNVSLVGILNADKMLGFPDFRSVERGFQTMMQVAGRAGRKKKKGKVLIQTYNPSHWLLDLVKSGDFSAFYEKEVAERYQFGYPPFARMMKITLKHKEEETVHLAANAVARILLPMLNDRVLGPEKPYIPRINNYYLQQFMVKLDRTSKSAEIKEKIVATTKEVLLTSDFRSVRLNVDIDPM